MGEILHNLEKTVILSDDQMVRHYTCNPPKLAVLKKYGIIPIGDKYGLRDSRELLLIPFNVYTKQYGLTISPKDIQIVSETLLRKIDSGK